MKFQKTAIAAIVAGFAAAPMMASADTVLSGVVQVKYQGTDADDDDPDMAAGDVRIALATEHELNSGLIGYGSVQLNVDDLTGQGGLGQDDAIQVPQVDSDGSLTDDDPIELTSAATVASDNVYVGVKGGFGDVRLGEVPLAVEYGQLANDIHDVGTTVVDGLSYTGTFGPVGFGLNHSLEEDSDMIGAGINFNFAGATIGLGFEDRTDLTNFAVGASYAIAGFSIAAHTWTKGQFDLDVDTDGDETTAELNESLDDQVAFAVQVGYAIAGVSIGVTYSQQTTGAGVPVDAAGVIVQPAQIATAANITTGENEEQIIRLDLGYDLGGGMDLTTRIQNKTVDNEFDADPDDLLEYRVMLSKTF